MSWPRSQSLFDTVPDGLNWNITGWLAYSNANANPDPKLVESFDPYDDMKLYPYDNQTILGEPDVTVTLDVIMDDLSDGAN
jgi:iron transport multicopper oxidase